MTICYKPVTRYTRAVTMASNFNALNVNQSVQFITLTGQD